MAWDGARPCHILKFGYHERLRSYGSVGQNVEDDGRYDETLLLNLNVILFQKLIKISKCVIP